MPFSVHAGDSKYHSAPDAMTINAAASAAIFHFGPAMEIPLAQRESNRPLAAFGSSYVASRAEAHRSVCRKRTLGGLIRPRMIAYRARRKRASNPWNGSVEENPAGARAHNGV